MKRVDESDRTSIGYRANAIFDERIAGLVAGCPPTDFVAIDVNSGEFAVNSDELSACQQLRSRIAAPEIFVRRVGSRIAHAIGNRIWRTAP